MDGGDGGGENSVPSMSKLNGEKVFGCWMLRVAN